MTDNSMQLDSGGSYLFVGNSFTFGRVDPVMSYNSDNVRDLTSPAQGGTFTNTTGSNVYEPHPWGGVPGLFEAFASQSGLELDVAISARNAATLQGQYLNSNPAGWDLRGNVASQAWDVVVLQDNSTQPLPTGTGSVTFAAGSSTATLTIDPTADTKVETDETIGLQITPSSTYRTSSGVVTGTILNDDPTGPTVNPANPTVTLVAAPNAVAEDGAPNLVYTFTRTGPTTSALTVNFAAARDGSTAPSITEYTSSFQSNGSSTTGSLSFTSGTGSIVIKAGASSATFTIDPTPDTTVENDESVRLTLSANSNYNVGTQGAVSATILNDDFAPGTDLSLANISVSIASSAVYEDGSGNLVYQFTRSGSNTAPLTVNFSVSGTATLAGNDFTVTDADSFSSPGAADPNLQSFNTYAVKLAQYATTGAADVANNVPANPHADAATKVFLYETWARPNMVTGAVVANTDDTTGAVTNTTTTAPEYYLSLETMTADLKAAYQGLAAANPIFAGVAPVGEAFLAAVQNGTAMRNPYAPDAGKIDLWWDDNLHASKYGSYLSGLTLFGTLTGLDPRSLGAAEHVAADLGITPAVAAALQNVAAATLGFTLDAHWTAPGQVTELQGVATGLLATEGSFGFSDSDVADTHTIAVAALTPGSVGTFSAAVHTDTTGDGTGGSVNWLFTVDNADVAFVSPGTPRVEHFLVTISDANGGQAQRDVAVTINGSNNDAPVAVADTASISEDAASTSGNVLSNDTDVDIDDTHTVSAVNGSAVNVGQDVAGTYGTLHLNSDGGYTYTLANGQANVQALAAGQQVTDVFNYVNTDSNSAVSNTANLTVTVTGTNDAPVAVADTASINEDAVSTTGNVLTNDTDVDTGDTHTVSAVNGLADNVDTDVVGTYGTLHLNSDGSYTYTLNNTLASVQALAEGTQVADVFNYANTDNHSGVSAAANLTVTVTGTNDAPVAVADTASINEDAVSTTGNVLSNDTDVDTGDTHTVSAVNGSAGNVGQDVAGTYGTLHLNNDGSYTYTLNNALASVQALAAGQQVTDTFSYANTDNHSGVSGTQNLTVTVTGTNDAPVAVADAASINEDAVSTTGNVLTNDTDVDTGDSQTVAAVNGSAGNVGQDIAGTYGTLHLSSNGSYTYTLANGQANVQALAQGTQVTDIFSYTNTDNHSGVSNTANLTVTVTGTNDTPVNGVPGTLSFQANTSAAIAGLSVSDPDSASLTTTLHVDHGTLAVAALGGAAVSGSGTGTVTLTGSVAQINAALAASSNVLYHGVQDFFGVDTLTMTTSDGGPLVDTDQVTVQVNTLVTGTSGADSFAALAGNERIDAGAGHDTVIFNFNLTDASFRFAGNQVIVDTASSHTVLTGMEEFHFLDGVVNDDDGDPLVNDLFYYSHYHDVWNAHADADAHYRNNGVLELRSPNENFTPAEYLASNPDLIQAFGYNLVAAGQHYISNGFNEHRATNSFDAVEYLASNGDLIQAFGLNVALAEQHYIQSGFNEHRVTNSFDPLEYLASNGDLIQAFGLNPQAAELHYITNGFGEHRSTNAFDAGEYLASNPDLIQAFGYNVPTAEQHYIQNGFNEHRATNSFDALEYLASNTDLIQAFGLNVPVAEQHYVQNGFNEHRATNSFNAAQYLANYADLGAAFGNNLVAAEQHYITNGFSEGRTDQAPVINGDGGDNTLVAKNGAIMTGGAGADTFVFNQSPLTPVTITDFAAGTDNLQISASGFGHGLTAGDTAPLVTAADLASASHPGTSGYFIFDNAGANTGTLYWDATGGGGTEATPLAHLNNITSLLSSDFHIV